MRRGGRESLRSRETAAAVVFAQNHCLASPCAPGAVGVVCRHRAAPERHELRPARLRSVKVDSPLLQRRGAALGERLGALGTGGREGRVNGPAAQVGRRGGGFCFKKK